MSLARIVWHRPVCNSNKFSKIIRRWYSQHTINLADPAVQTYLRQLMLEHEDLLMKSRRTLEEARRLYEIKPIVSVLEQRIGLYDSIESLKELNKKEDKDPEVKEMIKEEAQIYLKRLKEIDGELSAILLAPCLTDGGILLEVTAGAGGQEAMLFARELFEMYESYAKYRDWEVDIASLEVTDIGGVRKASMLIQGFGVPELMRMEAGVHRVQRIPSTEKERDLNIETKRASGAGGQHVNTTDSAVRIVHIPTGITVECQEGRSQIKNREIAIQKLRTLLLQKQYEEQSSIIKSERKSQIGSSNRNEKIRTYNFPQDRVTEHREGGGTLHNIAAFMEGREPLEKLQESLLSQHRHQTLMEEIQEFTKKYQTETSNKSL
ncbi:hypothetical protein evm_004232 [Chilo suppressalis]|nr:hypothetical protein evm_004232 [Chilo suppressalis]